ncbi:DUF3885 domain-containing protein [Paenibacillus sepulcri]|uniref:DUF3885 domain-containing protein n=1 Tax=Paenibacillus sepulcri TaxID=359917 RepID=A0ABS7BWS9_9BACL|nr:DUF3885 domain-containing protein [Paenibacillus sepulcri]
MKQKESIDLYLEEHFPNLVLKSPLFYNAQYSIRFELGGGKEISKGREEQVYHRAKTIFNSINSPHNDIFLIIFVDCWEEHPERLFNESIYNMFKNYIPSQKLEISRTKHEYRYIEPDDIDNTTITYRYCVKTEVSNIESENFLIALSNQGMGLTPTIIGDVYFINTINNTIYHLYDDRGLDIVAEKLEVLKELYKKFNEWILEFDRPRINEMFT